MDFQKIADSIEKSSQETKDLLFSTELGEKLLDIARKFDLEEEAYYKIVDEIGYIILGLKKRFLFADSLTKIGIEKELANKINIEVDKILFSKSDSKETGFNLDETIKQKIEKERKNILNNKNIQDSILKIISLDETKTLEKQKFLSDKNWIKRIDEISKKYSLSETQDNKLKNLALLIIIGIENKDSLKQTIKAELSISELLSEQIINDLEERVFQYAFNQISETTEEKPVETKNEGDLEELRTMAGDIEAFKDGDIKEKPSNPVIFAPTLSEKPQIKAEPVKEQTVEEENKFKMVGNNFVPPNLPGVEIEEPKKSFLDMGTTTKTTPPKPQEIIQKPMVGVPRYTASPEALQKESEPEQKPTFGNITESKLNSSVSSQKEPPKTEAPNKYSSADPYREPLE